MYGAGIGLGWRLPRRFAAGLELSRVTTVTQPYPDTRITPDRDLATDVRELVQRRELLWFFVWRDLKIRYKQTIIGAGWAILQPVALMVVFTLFFGRLAGVPSDGSPYAVFSFVALLPWTYFSTAVSTASNSLVGHQNMISKVYFPRIYLPISSTIGGLADLAIASGVLFVLLVVYDVSLTSRIFYLPLFVSLAVVTSAGVGAALAAFNAAYRDVRYALPFLIQFWMFASPVVYSSSSIPEQWRWAYAINPMVGVIDGFRWALLDQTAPPVTTLAVSTAAAIAAFIFGIAYFRKVEARIVDIV